MLNYKTITKELRRHPAVDAFVPATAFTSAALPVWVGGKSAIGVLFYRASGEAGNAKRIHPPLARMLFDKSNGHALDAVVAPLFWPANQRPDDVVGEYPGPGLRGLGIKEADAVYAEYAESAEVLSREIAEASGDWDRCPELARWRSLYERIAETDWSPYCTIWNTPLSPGGKRAPQTAPSTAPHEVEKAVKKNDGKEKTMVDLGKSAGNLAKTFDALGETIRKFGDANLLAGWRRVKMGFEEPGFSVVVAGEFNRGKTTLVNNLLNLDLPTGIVPTTAMTTRIRYAESPALRHKAADGTITVHPLEMDSLALFAADGEKGREGEFLQVEIPNDWLKSRNISFIDTPGTGDLSEAHTATAIMAVASGDAVLVAMAAPTPGSLSEQAFVKEHILDKKIPRVAVVITKLDQVEAGQRAAVVEHIRKKVAEWDNNTQVWLGSDDPDVVKNIEIAVRGPKAILAEVEKWRMSPEHLLLRHRQLAAQTAALAESFRLAIIASQAACTADMATLARERDDLERALERQDGEWRDLQIAFERRGIECSAIVREVLHKDRRQLTASLGMSLRGAANPKDWWRQILPFQLSRELAGIRKQAEGLLRERIRRDWEWLDAEAAKRFAIRFGTNANIGRLSDDEIEIAPGEDSLANPRLYQTIARYAGAGVSLLAMLTMPPLMPFAMAGVASVSELFLRSKIEEQKENLAGALEKLLDTTLEQFSEEACGLIHGAYARRLTEAMTAENMWLQSQRTIIDDAMRNKDSDPERMSKLEKLLADTDTAMSRLRALS